MEASRKMRCSDVIDSSVRFSALEPSGRPLGHQQATDMPVRKRLTSNVSKGGWAHERECRNGSLEPHSGRPARPSSIVVARFARIAGRPRMPRLELFLFRDHDRVTGK